MKLEQLQDFCWALQLSEDGTKNQLLESVESCLERRRAELIDDARYAGVYKSIDRGKKRKRTITNGNTQLQVDSTEPPVASTPCNNPTSLPHNNIPIDPSLV